MPAACWPSTGGTRSTGSRAGNPDGVAGAVPAWRAGRRFGAGASPLLRSRNSTASWCSTSAAAAVRCRSASCTTTPPATSWPTWKDCGRTWASSSWLLFGGSWGSTLALAYGLNTSRARHRLHPARHLSRRALGDRLVPSRHARHLPRGVARLRRASAEARARRSIGATTIAASSTRNPDSHRPAARAWSRYEAACSTLLSDGAGAFEIGSRRRSPWRCRASRRTTSRNGTFVPEGWPWSRPRPHPPSVQHHRAGPLRHRLPAGDSRRSGAGLARARCVVVPDAGHSALEPGHSRGAGERHREFQAVDQRRRSLRPAISLGNRKGPT